MRFVRDWLEICLEFDILQLLTVKANVNIKASVMLMELFETIAHKISLFI